MARYREADQVDLVIVGAGAGGSVLAQRLARQGWRIVILEAGPFWHPDEDWVSDEAGSHQLYWNQKRMIGGDDPIKLGQEQLRPRSGRFDGPLRRLHAPLSSLRLRDLHERRGRRGLADLLRRAEAPLRGARARAASRRPGLAVGRSPPISVLPASGQRLRRRSCGRARSRTGSRCESARSGSSTGRSATARTAFTAAICLQGCKVNAKASPYVTHLPDALEHGVEIRRQQHGGPGRTRRGGRPGDGVTYVREDDISRAPAARQIVAVCRLLDRDPPAAAELDVQALPERRGQRRGSGRSLRDGAGRLPERRSLPRRTADVQGTPARGFLRAVL